MLICVPKEINACETRTALTPETALKLIKLGADVWVEKDLGLLAGFPDEDYANIGAKVINDRKELLSSADIVLRVRRPSIEEVPLLKKGSYHISFLDRFSEQKLIEELAVHKISAISMEMIPRISRAQKMDALTSQANLAGYSAVILAAGYSGKIFPMMTTAAGTVLPAKVFVIGAGVAGLQAIATARRLGASVEAFDTRPAAAEQVQSLGAKFVKIDIGITAETKEGYAKALTPEQLAKQREGLKKNCASADVVITTALVFGKKAPLIITADMISAMKRGSIIIDLAVESGGNVEGSAMDQIIDKNGVKIIAPANLPGRAASTASKLYSSNLLSLIQEFWNKEAKCFVPNLDDEIIKACLVT